MEVWLFVYVYCYCNRFVYFWLFSASEDNTKDSSDTLLH